MLPAAETQIKNNKKIYMKRWRQTKKSEVSEYGKKYYAEHKKRIDENSKNYRKRHPGRHREFQLRQRYNLSVDEYNRLFISQNGCCAICGKHQSQLSSILCVDHHHITKKIRGLLCKRCNLALGYIAGNIIILKQMMNYLSEAKEKDVTKLLAITG